MVGIVKNLHNQFVYELLSNYPTPQKIKRAHFSSLLKIKRLTADKANQIQEAACLTIGNSSLALQLELIQLIEMIRIQTKQINKVQEQINALMTEIDSPITSITGVGQRLGAVILAEIKNIHNFRTPDQLQAFAGLEPSILSIWDNEHYRTYGQARIILLTICAYSSSQVTCLTIPLISEPI